LAQPGKHVRSLFKVTRIALEWIWKNTERIKKEGRISDDNDSTYNLKKKKKLDGREDLPEYIKTHVIAFRLDIE
jgi:hypothetical protein